MDFTNPAIAALGKSELDTTLALLRETSATTLTPGAKTPAELQLLNRALEMQSPVEEFIHRSTQPTDAQQYLTLAVQASEIPPVALAAFDDLQVAQPHHQHDMNDDLAIAQLLANNGALFNGAVGGLNMRNSDSSAKAAIAALSGKSSSKRRRNSRIGGISTIATGLNTEEHAFEEKAVFDEETLLDEFDQYLDEYGGNDDDEEDEDDGAFDEGELELFAADSAPEKLPAYGHYGIESGTADRRLMT